MNDIWKYYLKPWLVGAVSGIILVACVVATVAFLYWAIQYWASVLFALWIFCVSLSLLWTFILGPYHLGRNILK